MEASGQLKRLGQVTNEQDLLDKELESLTAAVGSLEERLSTILRSEPEGKDSLSDKSMESLVGAAVRVKSAKDKVIQIRLLVQSITSRAEN